MGPNSAHRSGAHVVESYTCRAGVVSRVVGKDPKGVGRWCYGYRYDFAGGYSYHIACRTRAQYM